MENLSHKGAHLGSYNKNHHYNQDQAVGSVNGNDNGTSSNNGAIGPNNSNNNETKVCIIVDTKTPILTKIPLPWERVTLENFKLATGLDSHYYKYFFETTDSEFGIVKEEISDDDAKLPMYKGRIVAYVRTNTDQQTSARLMDNNHHYQNQHQQQQQEQHHQHHQSANIYMMASNESVNMGHHNNQQQQQYSGQPAPQYNGFRHSTTAYSEDDDELSTFGGYTPSTTHYATVYSSNNRAHMRVAQPAWAHATHPGRGTEAQFNALNNASVRARSTTASTGLLPRPSSAGETKIGQGTMGGNSITASRPSLRAGGSLRSAYDRVYSMHKDRTDMRFICQQMMLPTSGLEVKDREWLKITIPKAFLGSDVVKWLQNNVYGFRNGRETKKYANQMLNMGYFKDLISSKSFSEKCYYVFSSDI